MIILLLTLLASTPSDFELFIKNLPLSLQQSIVTLPEGQDKLESVFSFLQEYLGDVAVSQTFIHKYEDFLLLLLSNIDVILDLEEPIELATKADVGNGLINLLHILFEQALVNEYRLNKPNFLTPSFYRYIYDARKLFKKHAHINSDDLFNITVYADTLVNVSLSDIFLFLGIIDETLISSELPAILSQSQIALIDFILTQIGMLKDIKTEDLTASMETKILENIFYPFIERFLRRQKLSDVKRIRKLTDNFYYDDFKKLFLILAGSKNNLNMDFHLINTRFISIIENLETIHKSINPIPNNCSDHIGRLLSL